MVFIEELYKILCVVFIFNFFATMFIVWPKSKDSFGNQSSEKIVWTWKDSLWLGVMFISVVALILCSFYLSINYKIKVFLWIILLSGYVIQIARTLSCVGIVSAAISKEAKGNLNKIEHEAILMSTVIPIYLFSYGIAEKVYSYATTYPQTIYSDWMTILFYVLAISILAFFISVLAISPINLLLKGISKLLLYVPKKRIYKYIGKLQELINGNFNRRTFCSALIEHSMQLHIVLRTILWILLIPAIILDIIKDVLQLIALLIASIVWYILLIFSLTFSVLGKIGTFFMSLSDRNILAICFRVAIIVGLGCTVILNRYEPFLHNEQESTAILEFISSVIIIPIVFEWISSYTKFKSNEKK